MFFLAYICTSRMSSYLLSIKKFSGDVGLLVVVMGRDHDDVGC